MSFIPHSHQLNMFNQTRFRKMRTIKEKLQLRLLCRPVSGFYKENNFKPCLTKQLLNIFKLWCERGIRFSFVIFLTVVKKLDESRVLRDSYIKYKPFF